MISLYMQASVRHRKSGTLGRNRTCARAVITTVNLRSSLSGEFPKWWRYAGLLSCAGLRSRVEKESDMLLLVASVEHRTRASLKDHSRKENCRHHQQWFRGVPHQRSNCFRRYVYVPGLTFPTKSDAPRSENLRVGCGLPLAPSIWEVW